VRTRILINGRDSTLVDARDRGLNYGDGLFETIAVVDGVARRWSLHRERLARGCTRLGIAHPEFEELEQEIQTLSADEARAVVKVIVTRGIGARGLSVDPQAQPTRIVGLHPWPVHPPEWAERGVHVRLCTTTLADQPALAGIKHLNRLEQVLARREWSDAHVAEGLMCDRQGAVVCGTMTNMFMVREGRLLTPAVDRCGVAGTVRATVLERAHALGIPAVQALIMPNDLRQADEVFLTNALVGLWAVNQLDDRALVPGPVWARLRAAIQ